MVARSDGQPITWPEPTHGGPKSVAVIAGLLKPWRTAADIRHYGLFANSARAENLIQARKLLNCERSEAPAEAVDPGEPSDGRTYVCPACGAPMIVIEIFARGQLPRAPPPRVATCA